MSRVVSAKAVVTVTLSVPVSSVWGADCPLGQVHKQAVEEALNMFRTHTLPTWDEGLRLVGDPLVKTVLVEAL